MNITLQRLNISIGTNQKKDGFYSSCKGCVLSRVSEWRAETEYDKKRYWDNRETELARNKEYKSAHYIPKVKPPKKTKTEYALYKKEWYEKNKEHVIALNKARRLANPEKYLQKDREARLKNRDVIRALKSRYKARRRARIKESGGNVTAGDIRLQYKSQKGLCWWCGKSVGDNYHVDHLTPIARGGGHNPNNIVISCPACNCSRQDKMPYEWSNRLI